MEDFIWEFKISFNSYYNYLKGNKNEYYAQRKVIFDNLLKQDFTISNKNKVWCTDFTYMRQANGRFRYNCTIIDLYDRSAITSVNADYMNTEYDNAPMELRFS